MRGPCPCVLNRIKVIRIHFQLRTLEGGHPFLCLWTIHWHCWGGFWSPVFLSPSLLTSLLTQQWYSPYVIDISMVGCLCSGDKENGNRWYRCKGFDWIKDNNFFVLVIDCLCDLSSFPRNLIFTSGFHDWNIQIYFQLLDCYINSLRRHAVLSASGFFTVIFQKTVLKTS